jgi:glyoxylase-like metal-dependent hydrolase (beta-lactamase superfamily II)
LALGHTECQSSLMDSERPDIDLGDWREIAPGVWVVVAAPAGANLGLVVGSRRALVVDAGASPAQGRALREAVQAVTDRPLAAVVLTHWHYDHAYGLAAFGDVDGVAHESVPHRLRSAPAAEAARKLGLDASRLALPPRRIAVATGIDLGDRRVEVAHLGRGHTDGDLVVAVPDADVVFAGDLVESAGPVWYGEDSFAHEWAATLDGLLGLMTAATVAVPGHGEPVNRPFVFEQRSRVAAVSGEIRRLVESGVPVDQALSAGDWVVPREHIAPALSAAYAQLGPVTPRRRLPLA